MYCCVIWVYFTKTYVEKHGQHDEWHKRSTHVYNTKHAERAHLSTSPPRRDTQPSPSFLTSFNSLLQQSAVSLLTDRLIQITKNKTGTPR
jgi:hypothetical protein